MDSDRVQLTAREFIERVFVQELPSLQSASGSAHYLQCTLIGVALESLADVVGARVTKKREYYERFKSVLGRMPPRHQRFICDGETCLRRNPKQRPKVPESHCLYHGLRCGSAHRLRPFGIEFTHAAEAARGGTTHLEPSTAGNLVLVSETLVHDFKQMCQGLLHDENLAVELARPWLRVGAAS